MRRRQYLATTVAAAGLAGCSTPTSKPNFVVFMTDDQGHDDVGYAGRSALQTPALDEMAENNLRLNRAYSAAPVCTPTRAGLLTGRHPNRMGAFNFGHTITPQEKTIAEILGSSGYTTGFFGKWHIGSVQEDAENSPGSAGFDEWAASPNYYDNDPVLSVNGEATQFSGESSMVTVELALQFIKDGIQSDQPFLAIIWTGSPHKPFELSDDLHYMYEDDKHSGFFGELTGIDHALGRLRSGLREEGVADNTLLWFTSDNGSDAEFNDNMDYRGSKGTLYEGGLRVPGIIEWPAKISAPRQSNHLVTTADILPTLADIADAELPDDRPIDGVSLLPHIENKRNQRPEPMRFWYASDIDGQPVYSTKIMQSMLDAQKNSEDWESPYSPITSEAIEESLSRLENGEPIGNAALIDGKWKLHQRGQEQFELYNLATDPNERNNIISSHQTQIKKMKQELASWRDSVRQSMAKTASQA